jgi:hypothetical protein
MLVDGTASFMSSKCKAAWGHSSRNTRLEAGTALGAEMRRRRNKRNDTRRNPD